MTKVIHGLTREQLIKRVFGETKPAQRDSRPDKSGPYLKDMLREAWLARAKQESS